MSKRIEVSTALVTASKRCGSMFRSEKALSASASDLRIMACGIPRGARIPGRHSSIGSFKALFLRFFGLLFLLFVIVGRSWSQEGTGFYLSHNMGFNLAPKVILNGSDTDRASVCDEFINPLYAAIDGCTSADRGLGDEWSTAHKGVLGILSGAAVGYRFTDRIRVEEQYSYRASAYNQTAPLTDASGVTLAKLVDEIGVASQRIGSVISHAFFSNVYFDFTNASRFTPYIGAGVGVGLTNVDYGGLFARNADPSEITTGSDLPNEAEVRQNLAATTTSEQQKLSDTLVGYQVLFGGEFALTERVSVGTQGRWVTFGSFSDGDTWNRLRSHASNLRLDGSEPVTYQMQTKDTGFFGVSFSIKYFL